ncbi:MAG: glycosyltransferase family 4 protein [Flavobacteriaceae bacterium]|nr:glycosyltransferase family 4 protein [Flavobacteriaceae bacterium]
MKPNLKIIIFDGSFKTTTFINRLAKGLSKNHEVFIVGFNNTLENKISKIKYIDLGSSQNLINLLWQSKWLATKRLFKTGNFKTFFKTLKNIFTLNKKQLKQDNFNTVLKLIKPDIVHVQWQSLLSWCEDALLQQKYKFVISQRGYQSNVRPFVNQENFEYLQKWYPKFAGFHSVSKAIALEGDKIYSSNKKINKVVYSGFDFSKLIFNKEYQKQEPLQILSVGRPHWKKGYSDAFQACKILKEKQIDFNYTIIGITEQIEELLYLINDLGLQKSIILLPKISQQEVYQKMEDASIFLLPSLEEGIANVVIEAMALGIPVISTNCGGMEELIIDKNYQRLLSGVEVKEENKPNKTGWLVPTRNPEALVSAIIDFTKTPDSKIKEIRLAARQKVAKQHSEEMMVSGMETLYFEVSCHSER